MFSSITSTLVTCVPLILLLTNPSLSVCIRSDLLAAASKFVTAVSTGNIASLPFSTNFTFRENNKAASITSTSAFSQPLKIDLSRSTADTVACASYTLIISSSGPKPYVLAIQIRHPKPSRKAVECV